MSDKEFVLGIYPDAKLRMCGSNSCRATYPQICVGNKRIGEGHADDWSGASAWQDAAKEVAANGRN